MDVFPGRRTKVEKRTLTEWTCGSRCLEVAAMRLDSGADGERTESSSQEFLHLLIKHRGNRIEPEGLYQEL